MFDNKKSGRANTDAEVKIFSPHNIYGLGMCMHRDELL